MLIKFCIEVNSNFKLNSNKLNSENLKSLSWLNNKS